MKKVIAFLFAVTILLTACSGGHPFKIGESMSDIHKQYTAYLTMSPLSAYKVNENYLITIADGDTIQKLAEFSSDRKCLRAEGLDLIKSENISQFLNLSLKELTEKLGQPHADVGSGLSLPAYMTEDANLICFELENEIVIEVIQRDLLSNEIVDRIHSE